MTQSYILVHNDKKTYGIEEVLSALSIDDEIDTFLTLDLLFEDSNSIGVSDVGEVVGWDSMKSDLRKVCIIREAQKLTTEAQNALLKVVEEPNSNSIIIFDVTNEKTLLQTIRSRCTIYKVGVTEIVYDKVKVKKFLDSHFLERKAFLDSLLIAENKRQLLQVFIEGIITYIIEEADPILNKNTLVINEVLQSLKKSYIATQKSVNIKLIAHTVNITLEKLP